jgi:hypothetical protein
MGASSGIPFVRRLSVGVLAGVALSLIWSSSAFAQAPGLLGLGSSPGSQQHPVGTVVNGVTETVAPVAQTAAPVVQNITAPVAQVTAPVAQTTAPVVQSVTAPVAQVTAPVAQTAAPVVNTVTTPVAQATAPVVQTAAPVVNAVTAPVAQVTAPIVQAAAPLLEAAAPVTEVATPILEAAAPVLEASSPLTDSRTAGDLEDGLPLLAGDDRTPAGVGSLLAVNSPVPSAGSPASSPGASSSSAPLATATAEGAPIAPGSNTPGGGVTSTGEDLSMPLRLGADHIPRGTARPPFQQSALLTSPGVTRGAPSGDDAAKGTKARAPSEPSPSTPSGPSVPSSAAALFSGSGASIFVAALVAALLLAVPGLSRRLRLELAPWPLPIPLPSLERPG